MVPDGDQGDGARPGDDELDDRNDGPETIPLGSDAVSIRRVRLTVIEGPGVGLQRESSTDRFGVGSHPLNDMVIADPTVSRFHCEVRIEGARPVITDLKSRNGTLVDGVAVREAFLRDGGVVRLGRIAVRVDLVSAEVLELPATTRFGALVGTSRAMRATIALLERAAASDVTVLLEGETGTGKGKAAEALHNASARKKQPFVPVDCGAIPANLLDSELFGHERGAFTGADRRRAGAFEDASGGTVFLDEIGELPAELQPKLLRVLENREIRPIGQNRFLPIDIRVIAATNRDLRSEVNAGRFRSDLYYRLAVAKILIPPLRTRADDIPALVAELLEQMGVAAEARAPLVAPGFVAKLRQLPWPGNARELRNYLERCLVFDDAEPAPAAAPVPESAIASFAEARKHAQAAFERTYLETLLQHTQGKVALAAKIADVNRVSLYRMLRRYGLKPG